MEDPNVYSSVLYHLSYVPPHANKKGGEMYWTGENILHYVIHLQ